jgi:hypothetical protein
MIYRKGKQKPTKWKTPLTVGIPSSTKGHLPAGKWYSIGERLDWKKPVSNKSHQTLPYLDDRLPYLRIGGRELTLVVQHIPMSHYFPPHWSPDGMLERIDLCVGEVAVPDPENLEKYYSVNIRDFYISVAANTQHVVLIESIPLKDNNRRFRIEHGEFVFDLAAGFPEWMICFYYKVIK